MVTIQEAKSQVAQQRQLLVQKRGEISEAEENLQELRQKLPAITQRRLRQGSFAGLKGRQRLKAVERARKVLDERGVLIGNYGDELTDFESQNIGPVEEQIRYIEGEQAAAKHAEKLYADRVPLNFVSGSEYKYLKDLYNFETLSKEALGQQVTEFETANPGSKLVVDWKKLQVKGVTSKAFQQSLSVGDYNKRVEELNKQLKDLPEIKGVLDVSRDLDRTSKIKDFGPISEVPKYGGDLFPFVSAESDYFLTTGSPIKYAPITGYAGGVEAHRIPSGYVPPSILMTPLSPEMLPEVQKYSLIGGAFEKVKGFVSGGTPTLPKIEAQYLAGPDITIVSAQVPQFGTVTPQPEGVPTGYEIQTQILPGKVDITPPTFPEFVGSGVRFAGERIPGVKDIIKSKDIIDIQARQSQEILRQLEDPSLSQKGVQGLIKEFRGIGGRVETTKRDGETFYQFYEPTVTIGAVGRTEREIPVGELSRKGGFRYGTGILAGELGAVYREIGEDIGLKEEGVIQYTTKAKDVTLFEPQFGTVQYDILTGKPISVREETFEVPAKTYKIGTPEQLGKTVGITTEVALFPVSYLGGLGEAAFTAGEFGGPKGAVEYVKEYPAETAIMGTFAVGGLGLRGVKAFRKPEIRVTELKPTGISGESLAVISKPQERYFYTDPLTGKSVVREDYGIIDIGKQVVKPGRKVEVVTGVKKFVDWGQKPLARKESLDVLRKRDFGFSRKEAEAVGKLKSGLPKEEFIKELKRKGVSKTRAEQLFTAEGQVRETIRLRRPQVQERFFKGKGTAEYMDEGVKFYVKGAEKIYPAKEKVKGVRYLQKEPEVRFIKSVGAPEGKLFRVATEAEKAFLRKGKYPYTKLSQLGKTTKTYESLIGAKKVRDFPTAELYKQLGVGKQIIPKKRFVDVSKSNVFVMKGKPEFIITDETIAAARGFRGKGKKSARQYLEQLYKTEEGLAASVFALRKAKPIAKLPKAPKMAVEVPTKQVSKYFGKGMYERTFGGMLPTVSAREQVTTIPPVYLPPRVEKQFVDFGARERVTPLQRIDVRLGARARQDVLQISRVEQKQLFPAMFAQTQTQKTLQRERQRELTRQRGTQVSIQRAKVVPGYGIVQRPKLKPPKGPTIKIPGKTFLLPSKPKKLDLKGRRRELYTPEYRRFGQWIPIGEFKSKQKAEQIGFKKTLATLGASIRLKRNGKIVPFTSRSPSFRPSKRELNVLIQKKITPGGGRLTTFQERKAIVMARKSGGFKWFK